jgi:hypothetical protein
MKRLLSAALALSLLGGSAAVAAPHDHGNQSYNGGYGNRDHGDNYRGHRGNDGTAGIGIFALAAILASQNQDHYYNGWYNHDGGYNRGDRGYDGGYSSYSHADGRW